MMTNSVQAAKTQLKKKRVYHTPRFISLTHWKQKEMKRKKKDLW